MTSEPETPTPAGPSNRRRIDAEAPATPASVADVAVVGLGPVGAMVAALLGRRGHRVVVLERHARPYDLPRAVHFDHEVGRLLQGLGLGEQLRAISESGSEYEWRSGTGQRLLRFGGRDVGPSGWPDSSMFWQPALERLLGVQFMDASVYFMSDLPAQVEWLDVARVCGVAFVLCTAATLYPAWRAARVAPAEALRHD